MSTVNYLTQLVVTSLKKNGHFFELREARDVNDLKRIYKRIYFGNESMSPADIKGAKLLDFNLIYKLVKGV